MNLALDPAVARKLDAYRRRRGRLVALRALCAGVVALLAGLAAVALIDWTWVLSDGARWALSGAAYLLGVGAAAAVCVGRIGLLGRREEVAAAIEEADPGVRERLLSAVELAADDPAAVHDSPAFRALLQGDVAQRMAAVRPAKLLPFRLVAGWALAAVLVVGLTAAAAATGGPRVWQLLQRAALPGANLARVSRVQVEVLEPSPASQTLPAGDTVAVVVRVTGAGPLGGGVEEVTLETAGAPGTAAGSRDLPMRRAASGPNGTTAQDEWAVNLTLGVQDVTYRVLAGDAITERFTLSVRPRPRITAFSKTVAFPDYAGLPDETVVEPHGDLFFPAGSTVALALEPNQPVSAAELRRTPADPSAEPTVTPLIPEEGPDGATRWTATLPMDAPGTYRVHLVAAETGFDNPFAPRSEIRPLPDAPPTVAFTRLPPDAGARGSLLLPPDDLLDLAASAADDLPLDRVEQRVSINGGDWTSAPLDFAPVPDEQPLGHAVTLAAAWRWDLLPLRLKTGDEVRTKLTATDRKGQVGESATLRVLIAGEDFDPARHAAAARKLALVDDYAAFASALEEQQERAFAALERLKEGSGEAARTEEFALLDDLIARRRDAAAALANATRAALPEQPAGADALDLDLLAQFASKIGLTPAAPLARDDAMDQVRDAARRDFERAAKEAAEAERFLRKLAAHNYLAAIAADLDAVHRQQERTADLSDPSRARLARQEAVVVGRLEAVEQFARAHRDRLTDEVRREADKFLEGSGELRIKLEEAAAEADRTAALAAAPDADDPGSEDKTQQAADEALRRFREAARAARDELAWRRRPNRLHGSVANDLKNAWRDLRNRTDDLAEGLKEAASRAGRSEELRSKLDAAEDSATADRLRGELAGIAADPRGFVAPSIGRLRVTRVVQKARADADTVFAADAGLAARALSAVVGSQHGEPGAEPPGGVAPSAALGEIGPALRTLEAGHELTAARRLAETLRERERWNAQTPAGRFDHPRQWDAFSSQLEYALDRLKRADAVGEDRQIEHAINRVRWSPAAQRAQPLIADRRWKTAGPVAADAELAEVAAGLRGVEADLAPTLAAARAVLERYAPTIPELARAAAEAARQREAAAEAVAAEIAGARTEAEGDESDSREAVRELAREQAAAQQSLDELVEALADDADRQDLADESERNRARDADAAVAAVRAPADAAERALADAARADDPEDRVEPLTDAAERQADTAEALDLVAEHFDRLDAGEDATETRDALREAAAEAGAAAALEERFAPSEALAEAAAGDPSGLLERLEAELAANPAMREALSEIASDAAADAENALADAAAEERDIQNDLDRSDPVLKQRKEEVAEDLRALAKAAERLNGRAAETAEKAADRGKADAAEDSLGEARAALKEAAEATRGATADAPLPELAAAARTAGERIAAAADALDAAEKQAAGRTGAEIHKDDNERNRRRGELERDRQRVRESQKRDAREDQRQAENVARRAESDVRRAERETREAENRAKKAAQDAAKNPEDAGRAQRAAEAEQQAAERNAQEATAKQARDAAKAAAERAKRATEAVDRQPNPKLDAANPAAQLAAQLAGEAAEDAAALKERAAEIAAAAGVEAPLNASEGELARSTQRQENVTGRVAAAAADLQRAARHEERLGQPANAERLDAAAEAVADLAADESAAAEAQLAEATDAARAENAAAGADGEPAGEPGASGEATEARAAVAAAEAALSNRAGALAALNAPPTSAPAASAPPSGDGEPGSPQSGSPPRERITPEQRTGGRRLARQLDALDRRMNAPPPASSPTDAAAELFAAAAAAQSAAVSAARAAQNAPPGLPSTAPPGEPSSGAAEGRGVAAGQGGAGVNGVRPEAITDADWATLRRRDAEDVTAGRSAAVSEEYRDSVNAYFRVLGERARRDNSNQRGR